MDEIIAPATGTRKELTLDSIFLYARQLYLWEETLPHYATFALRESYGNITPERTAYERELYAISQYATRSDGQPYEWTSIDNKAKYSYLERYSGSTATAAIATRATTASYAAHLTYWTVGNRTIAYLYIASFPILTQVQTELDAIFAELTARKVTHLILDLRHNGGGYVKTTEYLANLIAPASLQGKVMFSEQFNSRMQEGRATILQYQPYLDAEGKTMVYNGRMATMADVDYSESANTKHFDKKGEFQSLVQLSFIVSGQTASAAELLISIFKPHLPLRLIGQRTYGKPVGFVPIRIDQYQVYLPGFLIRNAEGCSDYFDGIAVDISVPHDHSDLPIGDPAEPYLAATLADIDPSLASSGKSTKFRQHASSISRSTQLTIPSSSPETPMLKEHFTFR